MYKYIFFVSMGVKYVDHVSLSLLYCYLQIYFCCVAFMLPLNLSSRSCSIAFLKKIVLPLELVLTQIRH